MLVLRDLQTASRRMFHYENMPMQQKAIFHGCKNDNFQCIYSFHIFAQYIENTHMQYTVIFNSCKNGNFQMKNCDIFLIFAQYIDCGYTLEPPH